MGSLRHNADAGRGLLISTFRLTLKGNPAKLRGQVEIQGKGNKMMHKVLEEGITKDQDGEEQITPVAILTLLSENNVIFNRLILKPCGHVDCAERFEMSLN